MKFNNVYRMASILVMLAITFGIAKAQNSDKATVRLVVDGTNCNYLPGASRYQLLLDANHQLADTYRNDLYDPTAEMDLGIMPRIYEDATATIPEDLSAANFTTGIALDREASIEVEPGTYDIFLFESFYASWNDENLIRVVYEDAETHDPFYVDDVELQAGLTYTFYVTFNIRGNRLGQMSLPVDLELKEVLGEDKPACGLEQMTLSLLVANVGAQDVDGYEISYVVGQDTVKETVTQSLKAGEETVVSFNQKIALKAGVKTTVRASVLAATETFVNNNSGSYTALYLESNELPAAIDLTQMHAPKASAWTLDKNGALTAVIETSSPIFSPCFSVEKAGTYRISYEYICGRVVITPEGEIWVNNVDSYQLYVGKSNQDISQWKLVEFDSTVTGSSNYDEFTPKEVRFELAEAGDYAFCIWPQAVKSTDNLKFRNVEVSEIEAYAARFNQFSLAAPRIIPQEWTENASYALSVTLENRGSNKLENADVIILVNGQEAARKSLSLDLDEQQSFTVDVPVPATKAGEKLVFSAQVVLDQNLIGKSGKLDREIEVSQTEAAFDHLTESTIVYAEGLSSYANALTGLIFPVLKTDTLTAIKVGWVEISESMEVGVAVHRISEENGKLVLGDLIYRTQARRGFGGFIDYPIPARLLTPGNYFISVEQLENKSFVLAVDESAEGCFYAFDPSDKVWNRHTQAGYIALRAVFASGGELVSNDAEITEISKPIQAGIFADNEPIVLKVRNNGVQKTEIPVHVLVDNLALEPKSVSLEPYAEAEVVFNADLSANNADRNIVITAFTNLSNDENRSNDTLRKTVLSFAPSDPYKMDFESCLDFATQGFNPAWTSYSLDKSPVLRLRHVLGGEFQYVDFPGSETDLGFIAFNPVTTEPSMLFYEFYNACRPHSGSRFGASLAISNIDIPKNDWLVSPKLKMPASNTQLSMWVKSFDKVYREEYEIWVSFGSGNPEDGDFERVYPPMPLDEDEYDDYDALIADGEWERKIFDLSAYDGKDIHVAIRCVSFDADMFMIDDIVIGDGTDMANDPAQKADFRLMVYPNPVYETMTVLSPDAPIKQVAIFSPNGSLVHRSAGNLNTENYRYNASGLVSGLYFVEVTTDRGTSVIKFVVR